MSKATALRDKIGKVLTRVGATDRSCFIRTYTRIGGDPLLGRPGSVYTQDKAIVPTPAITSVSSRSSGRNPGQLELMILSGGVQISSNDLMMVVSPLAISKEDVENKDNTILLRDPSGYEQEYTMAYVVPNVFGNTVIVYDILLSLKKR